MESVWSSRWDTTDNRQNNTLTRYITLNLSENTETPMSWNRKQPLLWSSSSVQNGFTTKYQTQVLASDIQRRLGSSWRIILGPFRTDDLLLYRSDVDSRDMNLLLKQVHVDELLTAGGPLSAELEDAALCCPLLLSYHTWLLTHQQLLM